MKAQPEWRTQVYEGYVHHRTVSNAPDNIEGLRSRSYQLKRLITEHFPTDRKSPILEVGCGHGALMHFALELGYLNVRGVDGSSDQVAQARKLGIEGVEAGDAMVTLRAQQTASLAAVVAYDIIEHFDKQSVFDFARETYRVLRPSGRWILHTVNGSSPFHGDVRYGDITHELAFTRHSMGQLLTTSGFAQMRFYEDVPTVHGISSAFRWLGWRVIRAALRLWDVIETGDSGRDAVYSRNFIIVAVK